MVVTDTALQFRPRKNDGSATLTLRREVELLEFNVRLTTMRQVEEMFVQGWNPKDKKEVVAHSRTGDERPMDGSTSGPAMVRRVFSGTGGKTVNTPVSSQAEADQLAERLVRRDGALLYRRGRALYRSARTARRDAGQGRRLGAAL